jgi:tetratricopeptide (TPR) repeat protein
MALGLELYWCYRGLAEEGLPRFITLLEKGLADPGTRARILRAAGDLAYYVDDRELESRCLLEAVEIFETLGDADGLARAQASLVWSATARGDAGSARHYAERAVAALADTDDPWLTTYVLNAASVAAAECDDLDEATRLADRALRIAQEGGDPRSLWGALSTLGWLEFIRADYDSAMRLCTEASAVADTHDRELVAVNAGSLGLTELMLGRPTGAAGHFAASLSSAPPGNRRIPAEVMLGVAALVAGPHPDDAVRIWAASFALYENCGARPGPVLDKIETPMLAPLRSTFGSSEFDRLWEEGRRLTMPEAIDLAIERSELVTRSGDTHASQAQSG